MPKRSELRITTGDATAPEGDGAKIVAHVCNDIGTWGKGFVLALSRRWAAPEEAFRKWASGEGESPYELGAVQLVQVAEGLWVANLIGQHGIKRAKSVPPIRYEAIEACLGALAVMAKERSASVHMPRIGCGLAGGEWSKIEPLIRKQLCDEGVEVTVYDLA